MPDGTQAVLAIADELEFIREQWKLGDQEMAKLLDEGMEASQDGLERLMIANRGPIRETITRIRRKTIPHASEFLDTQLKTDLRDLLDHLDPVDTHLSKTPRWKLTWPDLETDTRYENLVAFVRAASRHTEQTKRTNANRRPGEERISPHKLGDFFRNPIAIREQCYRIANILPMIRDDWQAGDTIESSWILKGWSTAGDHFLSEKRGSRHEVDRLLNKIVSDSGPVVLPHLDPSLRTRLIHFCQSARPYEMTDVHGDRGERWHLRWEDLHLDDDVAVLGLELRAIGDGQVLAEIQLKTDRSKQTNTSAPSQSDTQSSTPILTMTRLSMHLSRSRTTVRKWAKDAEIRGRKKGEAFTVGELTKLAEAATQHGDCEAAEAINGLVDH